MYYGPSICFNYHTSHMSLYHTPKHCSCHDVPAGTGFLCYRIAMLRDTIKGTFCAKTMFYVRQINVRGHNFTRIAVQKSSQFS